MKTENVKPKVEHTPTPWKIETNKQRQINGREFKFLPSLLEVKRLYVNRDSIGGLPTTLTITDCINLNKENAEFIVRAVNCHEELVSFISHLVTHYGLTTGKRDEALRLLAKAEGKE